MGIYAGDNNSGDLAIQIRDYKEGYLKVGTVREENWSLVDEDNTHGITYYRLEALYKASWNQDNCLYTIEYGDLSEIEEIVKTIIK